MALGYERIDLVSESAGTRTAMIYAWRHPREHPSLGDDRRQPARPLPLGPEDDGRADRPLRRRSARRTRAAAARTDDLAASMRRTAADMPGPLAVPADQRGQRALASFFGLHGVDAGRAPLSAPMTIGSWLSAEKGDASGLWLQSLAGRPRSSRSRSSGATSRRLAGRRRRGRRRVLRVGRPRRDVDPRQRRAPTFVWAGGGWPTRGRPSPTTTSTAECAPSSVETLLIGGDARLRDPAANATRELLPYLPQRPPGRAAPSSATRTRFWSYAARGRHAGWSTRSSTRGKVDDSLYKQATVDFTPEVTQTALAKGFAGTMIGLALLDRALARADGAPRAPAGRLRPQGRRRAPVACTRSCSASAAGSSASCRASRRCPASRSTTSCSRRSRSALPIGLGVYLAWVQPRLVRRGRRRSASRPRWRRPRRRLARLQRRGRTARADHDDRRRGRRREPGPDPARHRVGPAGPQPVRTRRGDGDAGGASARRLTLPSRAALSPGSAGLRARGARRRRVSRS